ncbi:thiamine pyrophosphate-binding protein [Oxalobacteraceae bacterium]|nr:thiamine pyrophosphate-binding protein [Oxalobacteraceae bacterium]
MKIRVADYIVQRLREAGVDTVFMLNGGGMMHLVDAVGRCEGMRYVCSHHEQASAMQADGYARLSGQIGVCCATAGPGATNILTGIVGAWQDSAPLLFLTGQSKSTQTIANSGIEGLRQFGTFEVNIVPIVESVTKYAFMLKDAQDVRYQLEKALYLATTGRPGPVLLDLPLDLQGALVEPSELKGFTPPPAAAAVDPAQLKQLSELLARAKRPLLLAGVGVRAAHAAGALRQLAETLAIPVITTQLGRDVLHYDHPLFVGHSGPKGDRAGNFAVQTADLVISLGASLHGQTTGWENKLFAPEAMKVQIDLDPAVLAREQVNVGLKIQAGVAEFIAALLPLAQAHGNAAWRACCQDWKQRYAVRLEAHQRGDDGMNFYHFAEALSQQLPPEACVVSDAGSAFYVTGQALRMQEGQRFISSGSLGAMGYALPAASGAACVNPELPVVCVTGDGSLMTNVHDLATMRHYNLNLKLFVVNNDGYVSMRNTQREFFGGLLIGADSSSGVFIPSMQSLAESYQLPYFRCDSEEQVAAMIAKVLAMQGPVMCEIVGMRNQRIMPSVASKRLPDGRMVSTPIHDMVPNLPDEVLAQELKNALA